MERVILEKVWSVEIEEGSVTYPEIGTRKWWDMPSKLYDFGYRLPSVTLNGSVTLFHPLEPGTFVGTGNREVGLAISRFKEACDGFDREIAKSDASFAHYFRKS